MNYYSMTKKWLIVGCFAALLAALMAGASSTRAQGIGSNLAMGYWDNWGTFTMENSPSQYKVLFYAFAEGEGTDGATIFMYTPSATNPLSNLASDISSAHSQGRKVLLSIGGANSANVTLLSSSDVSTFVSTVESLISEYGFDGIDLDLENSSVTVNAGDSLTSPTTPDLVYMGQALQQLHSHFGSSFLISMVPETADIDAYAAYSGIWGSYCPLIVANKSIVSLVDIQCYDSGSMDAANGQLVTEGTADFYVAMAELMLHGYPVSGGSQTFPALEQQQVAFGSLVGTDTPSTAVSAWDYLTKGTSDGGSYKLLGGPYGSAAGMMVWDINTDVADGDPWADAFSSAGVNGTVGGGGGSCSATPSAPTGLSASGTTSSSTNLSWTAVSAPANCTISSYTVYRNGSSVGTSSGTTYSATGLSASTTYTFAVAATDSDGTGSKSSSINVTTSAASCSTSPGAPSGLAASGTTSTTTNLSWSAVTAPSGCSISSYTVYKSGTSLGTTSSTSYSVTGLSASTTYTFTVAATDSHGTSSQSSSITVTTSSSSCSTSPSAPTGLSASGTTSTSTDLSWSAVSAPSGCSISSYTVYKSGTSLGTTTSTSFTATGLTASTTYTFTVAATDSHGTGSQSSSITVTTSASSGGINCTGVAAWATGVSYTVGELVTYSGSEYKCLQAHTSEAGWDPPAVPALWSLVGACESGT